VSGAKEDELLQSDGSLVSWHELAGQSQLAEAAGRGCGLSALTAVAEVAGTDAVGGICSRPGTVGILLDGPGGWRLGGPALPGSLAPDRVEVLRLWSSGDGLTTVLAVSDGSSVHLLSAWSAGAGPWQVSPPLPLGPAGQLVSVGPDGASGIFVLSSAAGRSSLEQDSGPGGSWSALPAPPAGTATIAFVPGSAPEALTVDHSVLTVCSLGDGGWTATQTLDVSIQYGSSS